MGEAARKAAPGGAGRAAETCCYICWVKHGLCCDLKRVLKTHSSVAFVKEVKSIAQFFLMHRPNEVLQRTSDLSKCSQSLLIARWVEGVGGGGGHFLFFLIGPREE